MSAQTYAGFIRSTFLHYVICFIVVLSTTVVHAQRTPKAPNAELAGHVTDSTGALIPGAHLQLQPTSGGPAIETTADAAGRYAFPTAPSGTYIIVTTAEGFAPRRSDPIILTVGQPHSLDVHLLIAGEVQEVDVPSENGADVDPTKNGDSIVLKGKAVDDLPLDTTELTQQLNALAGSDTPELRIDGFSGGAMPPRSSIREIRINQNPYSAQNDTNPGNGMIEIFTKPGGGEFHGATWITGNDSSFNSLSPFVTQAPAYHATSAYANLSGPIAKHISFFALGRYFNDANNSVINAQILDPNYVQTQFIQAVPTPSDTGGMAARIDASIGTKSTIIFRYDLSKSSDTNDGVGNLSLASQGFNSSSTRQTFQFSNSQVISTKIVNDTRFQYIRVRSRQDPISTLPSIIVQGSFNGGGNNSGLFHDNQDQYELQNYTSIQAHQHFLTLGGRLRVNRDANVSRANYSGQFIFPTLTGYQIATCGQLPANDPGAPSCLAQGFRVGLTSAQIIAAGGGASQYSVTTGTPSVIVSVFDLGLFLQDDWKLRRNLTLSAGLRFETQNHIADHADWAPRLAFAWGFGAPKDKPQKYTLRGGAGFFYTRFAPSNVLQAQRQNGITQQQYVINAPTFYSPNFPVPSDPATLGGVVSSTTFQISPVYTSPYNFSTTLSLQRSLGKVGSITGSYVYNRGVHMMVTRNINAPLPGTYDPSNPASGTRPLGGTSNIYQYSSPADYRSNRLAVNWYTNFNRKVDLYGNYSAFWQKSDAWGTFPSNSYNVALDYGRAPTPVHTLNLGGGVDLPLGLRINPYLIARTGRPFNITVGTDLNGDAQYNDRPSFATDLSRPSVIKTAYGTFDTRPIAGQTIIPINYGMGPTTLLLNLTVGRNFNFGPLPKAATATPAPPPATNGKPAPPPERKYNLTFYVSAQNVLNHVNLAPPVGTLSSPLFGKSVSLSSGFGSSNSSANRVIQLQLAFAF